MQGLYHEVDIERFVEPYEADLIKPEERLQYVVIGVRR